MRRLTSYRGFTLIELLVVVAIIALLISILLPSLSRAREVARQTACQSILKQFSLANHMYADDSDGYFVPIRLNVGNPEWPWPWNSKFRAILGLTGVGATTGPGAGDSPSGRFATAGYMCPTSPDEEREVGHWLHVYGMSSVGIPVLAGERHVHRASVINPSHKVQMIDSTEWHMGGRWNANYETHWDVFGDNKPANGGAASVAYRHSEGANILYFDGHADHRPKEQVWWTGSPEGNQKWNALWNIYED